MKRFTKMLVALLVMLSMVSTVYAGDWEWFDCGAGHIINEGTELDGKPTTVKDMLITVYGTTNLDYITDNMERANIIADVYRKYGNIHGLVWVFNNWKCYNGDNSILNTGVFILDGVSWVYFAVPQGKGNTNHVYIRYREDNPRVAEIVYSTPEGIESESAKRTRETMSHPLQYNPQSIYDIEW